MVSKKDETAPEVVEETEGVSGTEDTNEVTDSVSEAPVTRSGPEVVGAITDPSKMTMERANICIECSSIWPIDKGVASCPACGGKTVSGYRNRASALVDADNARFTGASAQDPEAYKKSIGIDNG